LQLLGKCQGILQCLESSIPETEVPIGMGTDVLMGMGMKLLGKMEMGIKPDYGNVPSVL